MTDVCHVYVTLRGEDRIARFDFDSRTGRLSPTGSMPAPGGPAPVAVGACATRLHVAQREARLLSTFARDTATGALSPLVSVSLPSDPCYLGMDRQGRFVLSAYYEAGAVAVHATDERGAVRPEPIEWRETGRGAHCFQTDPTNRHAFVPHIHAERAPNEIRQFRFDPASGRLVDNEPRAVRPPGPLGPRHYCFHPSLDRLYFSNEQGGSVTAYDLDPARGTLQAGETVSTLPRGWTGQSKCSQIAITPDGRYLFAPNRGHDSIAMFRVDAAGRLIANGHVAAEPVPRAFAIDPAGRFVLSAGLESGRLVVFAIDPARGALEPVGEHRVGERPMWVTVLRAAG